MQVLDALILDYQEIINLLSSKFITFLKRNHDRSTIFNAFLEGKVTCPFYSTNNLWPSDFQNLLDLFTENDIPSLLAEEYKFDLLFVENSELHYIPFRHSVKPKSKIYHKYTQIAVVLDKKDLKEILANHYTDLLLSNEEAFVNWMSNNEFSKKVINLDKAELPELLKTFMHFGLYNNIINNVQSQQKNGTFFFKESEDKYSRALNFLIKNQLPKVEETEFFIDNNPSTQVVS